MGFSPVHKIHQKPLPFNKAFLCIEHPKCKMADMSSNDFFNDIWGMGGKKMYQLSNLPKLVKDDKLLGCHKCLHIFQPGNLQFTQNKFKHS
jgi:hypothetical protein